MDNITSNKKIFLKYLFSSIFSAIILSIYSLFDAFCVAQYEGEAGSAALGCGIPVWTLIYSLGLLCGIGGSTMMMVERGKGNLKRGNQIFTSSFILAIILCIFVWIFMWIFQKQLLILFGAKDSEVLRLITLYTNWLKRGLPFFFFNQFLTVYVRNDNDPLRASIGVVAGGVINMILDLIFVFVAKMGINGAGLATMLGQIGTILVLLSHFITKKNQLSFVKPEHLLKDFKMVIRAGFSSFVLDVCMGISTIIFNNQIANYNTGEMLVIYQAIFGVLINMFTLVQSIGYGVGQSSQPLLSKNVGKNDKKAINEFFKYGIITCIIAGIILGTSFLIFAPNLLTIFAKVEQGSDTMTIGTKVSRIYYISFFIIVFNVYSTYYFNSILKPRISFIISLLRGIGFPLLFYFVLPAINFDLLWYSIICIEGLIAIISIVSMFIFKFKPLEEKEENILEEKVSC